MSKVRNPSLDLVRVIAGITVLGVHFFLYTGFYSETIDSPKMFLPVFVRTFMMVCVPLFMMLSGYLMNKKTLTRRYYRGIVKTLVMYFFSGVAGILFLVFYLKTPLTFGDITFKFLEFSAANYAWYVEMYIGLFMIIPFINMGYHHIGSQKKKLVLVLTLCIMTALPSVLNTFDLVTTGWWANPTISDKTYQIVPDYWTMLYPITYYIVGAYLSEFPPKMSKLKAFVLLIISLTLFTVYNMYRSWGRGIHLGAWATWQGFEQLIDAALVLIILSKVNLDGAPNWVKALLKKLSDLTLGIYLISYIFDRSIYYDYFGKWVTDFKSRFVWYPVVVLCMYILSAAAAFVLSIFTNLTVKLIFFISDSVGRAIKNRGNSDDSEQLPEFKVSADTENFSAYSLSSDCDNDSAQLDDGKEKDTEEQAELVQTDFSTEQMVTTQDR